MAATAAAPKAIEITTAGLNKLILWSYPSIIGQAIILLESLRIIPAEVRIWARIWKRKRFNAAEMMFLGIKYFAVIGYTCDAVVHSSTLLKTGKGCYDTHYISLFCIFFATSLVALAIAWRTYIIFQCTRRIYWILCVALCIQLSLSMWTMSLQYKYTTLRDGYCVTGRPTSYFKISAIKLSLPWYLLYNSFYDFFVTAAATRHLVKNTGAPFGFSRVSKVLFLNNVHYVIVVCSANLVLAILFWCTPRGLPSLLPVSAALQIIAGMNLLTIEQDLVHRPLGGGRVSHAPSSGIKGNPGSSLPTSSTSGSSWQVTSGKYQTSTMQSDISSSSCSGGSPLLQHLRSKTRFDGAGGGKSLYHSRSGSDLTAMTQPHPTAITFEQNKIRCYDDGTTAASPKDSKHRKSGWMKRLGSPTKAEKEVATAGFDDHNEQHTMQDGGLSQIEEMSAPHDHQADITFYDDRASSMQSHNNPSCWTHIRDHSLTSLHFEPVYTPSKTTSMKRENQTLPLLSSSDQASPATAPLTTTTAPASTPGVSIRSIRAGLATTASSPSLDAHYLASKKAPINKKPTVHHRPQTSPESTSHPSQLGSSPALLRDYSQSGVAPRRPKQTPTLLFDLTNGCSPTSLQDQPYGGAILFASPLALRQSSSQSTVQRHTPSDAFRTSPSTSIHIPSTPTSTATAAATTTMINSNTTTHSPSASSASPPASTLPEPLKYTHKANTPSFSSSSSLRPSDFRKSRAPSQATVLDFDGTCDETETDLDRSCTIGDEMGTISFARRTQIEPLRSST